MRFALLLFAALLIGCGSSAKDVPQVRYLNHDEPIPADAEVVFNSTVHGDIADLVIDDKGTVVLPDGTTGKVSVSGQPLQK